MSITSEQRARWLNTDRYYLDTQSDNTPVLPVPVSDDDWRLGNGID